jgi:hypothetical protein
MKREFKNQNNGKPGYVFCISITICVNKIGGYAYMIYIFTDLLDGDFFEMLEATRFYLDAPNLDISKRRITQIIVDEL